MPSNTTSDRAMKANATFPHPPLLQGTDSIRLLQTQRNRPVSDILCFKLSTFPLDQAPKYWGLSYCWGSPFPDDADEDAETDIDWTSPTQTIYCNGLPYYVGQNLFDALLHISETYESIYLWVDALCISQADLAEKSTQVMLMGHIFSAANRVVCWLGREDHSSRRAVEFIKVICKMVKHNPDWWTDYWSALELDVESDQALLLAREHSDGSYPIQSPLPSLSHWRDYLHFCRRRYFTRLWVVQEYGLAKNPNFICGNDNFTAQMFGITSDFMAASASAHAIINSHSLDNTAVRNVDTLEAASLRSLSTESFRDKQMRFGTVTEDSQVPYITLAVCLANNSGTECSDYHDKIYALIGLAQCQTQPPGHLAIRPRYDVDPTTLFCEVASTLILRLPKLLCLSLVEDRIYCTTKGLPSWVPDFGRHKHDRSDSYRLTDRASAGIETSPSSSSPKVRVVEGGRLTLEGTFIDTIVHCALVAPRGKRFLPRSVLKSILELVQRMPLQYKATGQDRLEALWRTMIWNYDDLASSLATATTGEHFPLWLSKSLVEPGGDEDDAIALFKLLLDLVKASAYADSWLSQPPFKYLHLGPGSLTDPAQQPNYFRKINSFSIRDYKDKKVMRTSKGYLGLCLPSVKMGDQVWILRDAHAASILRPLPESSTYEFFGDAYVHGISHGEIFTQNPTFERVTLV